jgi:hypothetical protein
MIVLAGVNSDEVAAYDPATDEWRLLPSTPGNLQAPNPVAVWTGDAVVAVVRSEDPMSSPPLVASLRSGDDGWTGAPPVERGQVVLAWAGDAIVAAAGDEALLLDPGSDQWTPIAPAPFEPAVGDAPAVWTGSHLLIWDGDRASLIDPAERTWQSTPAGGAGSRTQPAVVWADGVLLAWGGFPDEASGIMLRPLIGGAPGTLEGEPLDASFTYEVDYETTGPTSCPVRAIRFTDTSSGGPTEWHWEFPDGSTSNDPAPTVEPGPGRLAFGAGEVRLTVRRGDVEDSVAQPVEIVEC